MVIFYTSVYFSLIFSATPLPASSPPRIKNALAASLSLSEEANAPWRLLTQTPVDRTSEKRLVSHDAY